MQQANKQAIHCISNPNSPGQKRGEEMRGEEKEFVIDHKKDKKKEERKKNPSRKKNPGAASEQAMSDV